LTSLVFLVDLGYERLDVIAIVDRLVEMKAEFGCVSDLQPAGEFAPDESACAFEPFLRFLQRILVPTQPVKVHIGVGKVWAHACPGDRHAREARILDPALYNVTQFSLHLVSDPVLTSLGHA
jgi:hypothetical protein